MCESNVYLYDSEHGEELFLEKVDKIIPQENGLFMENVFGERKTIKARIREMALVDHRIILEKI